MEDAERKARRMADITKEEEEEKTRHKEERHIGQLLTCRNQEALKVRKLIDTIEELIMTEDTACLKHKVGAAKDARAKLDDRMKASDQAQEKCVASLTDKKVQTSELDWIASILEAYNKTCTAAEIFISCNSCKEDTPMSEGRPGAASGIRLEKLKFDSFNGDLRKYPRFKEQFLKHVKPPFKPDEEAFVLRSYLTDEIKEEVDGLGEDID